MSAALNRPLTLRPLRTTTRSMSVPPSAARAWTAAAAGDLPAARAAEASAEAAVVLRRVGQPRDAAAVELKAARLLALCEGAVTPPVRIITARVRLTPEELDAAVQAAAGRSNKQIASDMQLSVRTVESHLQRAYDKLGVSGRHELANALREQPTA
jgi:DNA-binding CsgD family transcriptional regulator